MHCTGSWRKIRMADAGAAHGIARRLVAALVFGAGLSLTAPSIAQHRFEAQEVAALPAYCRSHPYMILYDASRVINKAESERWKAIIGAHPYQGLHHYCWAQALSNRARLLSKTKTERLRWLGASIGDFDYILNHTRGQPFVLTPEILYRKGENLLDLGRVSEGLASLQQAMQVKPDYWPPYAMVAEYYQKAGDLAKAREYVAKGLSVAPDARRLRTLQSTLGGTSGKEQRRAPEKAAPLDSSETAAKTPAGKSPGESTETQQRDSGTAAEK